MYGNGTEHDRFYNLDGNIYSLWYGNYTRDIAYDAAGRIQAFMNSDLPVYQEFTYDTVDRLTGHTDYAGTAFTITYDANGNRNQYQPDDANAINYAIDPNSNRLLSTSQTGGSTKTYTTDAAGNVLGNGSTTFTYDERGRLVKAIGPFGTEYYRINGLGQRTAKATGTGQTPEPGTYFAYDEAGHILGEYTQTGTAIQETVWMGDTPVAILQGNSNYYIYPDQQNTPRAIADSTGKIIWRWTDPTFGTKQPNPDPDGDGVQFTYNLRYPGQYYDASTGLHYNWHRSYDPATGRYLESDPIGLEGGLNTYAYVNGDPVNLTDPLGLSSDFPSPIPSEAQPLQCGLKDYCQPPKGLRGWARAAFLAWCLANNKRPPPAPPPRPPKPPTAIPGSPPKPGGGTPPDDLPPIPPTNGT